MRGTTFERRGDRLFHSSILGMRCGVEGTIRDAVKNDLEKLRILTFHLKLKMSYNWVKMF